MGYYSTVTLACNKSMAEKIDKIISTYCNKPHLAPMPEIFEDRENECYLYYWDFLKWYTGYDNLPGMVNKCLSEADDADAFAFLRVGEESEDVDFYTLNTDETPLESVYPATTLDHGDLHFIPIHGEKVMAEVGSEGDAV